MILLRNHRKHQCLSPLDAILIQQNLGLCRPRLTATAGGRFPLFTAALDQADNRKLCFSLFFGIWKDVCHSANKHVFKVNGLVVDDLPNFPAGHFTFGQKRTTRADKQVKILQHDPHVFCRQHHVLFVQKAVGLTTLKQRASYPRRPFYYQLSHKAQGLSAGLKVRCCLHMPSILCGLKTGRFFDLRRRSPILKSSRAAVLASAAGRWGQPSPPGCATEDALRSSN